MQAQTAIENDIKHAIKLYISSVKERTYCQGDIAPLVAITDTLELKNLEFWERSIRDETTYQIRHDRPKWERWFLPDPKNPWLGMIYADGYVRENSLRNLTTGAPNAFFLALFIRRFNDWVPQVRAAASHALPIVIQNTAPECIVQVLSMAILRWHTWEHIESSDKALLLQIISHPDRMPQLVAYLINATAGPIPTLLAQVGRSNSIDPYLNHIADNAVQPYVRAKAFRCLFEGRLFWLERREFQPARGFYGQDTFTPIIGERKITVHVPLLDLLHRAANDHSSIVRKVAAEFVIRNIETLGSDARDFATRFTADSSDNVAEQGSYILKKLGEQDK